MFKIRFMIESFGGGGAERVLLTLLRNLDYTKFDVTLVAISDVGTLAAMFKELPIKINVVSPAKAGWISRMKYRLICRWLPSKWAARLFLPSRGIDLDVAFVEGRATKLIANTKSMSKASWVHIDLKNYSWPINLGIYRNLDEERKTYRRYSKVICVSDAVAEVMKTHYELSDVGVIYNPIDEKRVVEMSALPTDYQMTPDTFNIVTVGRLVHQKGFDNLIEVAGKLKMHGLNFHLHILGEGPERQRLEGLLKELGLTATVSLPGYFDNPYSVMTQADLFVCSSRAEGFSLVIAEALTLGLPVASTRCSGPEELLGFGKYGILCDDVMSFENAIMKLATQPEVLETMRKQARIGAEHFSTESTMKKVENLFEELATKING